MYALAPAPGPLIGGRLFGERYVAMMLLHQSANWRSRRCRGVQFFSTFRKPPRGQFGKKTVLQLDPVGIARAMAAIICFILGLRYGGTSHLWNSSQVIGLLIGF